MKTVLITGASGFIGKNLCEHLQTDTRVLTFSRHNSIKELETMINISDFVFHLAAVMRPSDEAEFENVNINLTDSITKLITKSGRNTPLLLTSSIQAELDNDYGRSKRVAEENIVKWVKDTNGKAYIYRLPNVFGKLSKPNYTSVVATFCYNISHNLPIEIHDPKARLNLAYVDDVIDEFIKKLHQDTVVSEKTLYFSIPRIFSITIQELADEIYKIHNSTNTKEADAAPDLFEKFLYVTYTYFKDLD